MVQREGHDLMAAIQRDPASAAKDRYDAIVVGGGIYGVMLACEGSGRGLKTLLVEKDDFGGATSANSLRIIHGGLRYLQTLDLPRFRESVAERRWFLSNFPRMIQTLPCLMPLYGDGLRRPSIFRVALFLNDFLGRPPGDVPSRSARELPPGEVIDAEQVKRIFPTVDMKGLKGGAIWHDAFMPNSQRVLITILRKGCSYGATALNYMEAGGLLKCGNAVTGIKAVDRENGNTYEYLSPVVINATGPWCENLADRFGSRRPELFRRSVAWNILLDREPPGDHALAVRSKVPRAQTYFFVPWKGKMLAGTGHSSFPGEGDVPAPSEEQLFEFLEDLNMSMPGLEATGTDILHVFSGFLPVTNDGGMTLTTREVIFDHGRNGGPQGLYSVAGIKFTTARKVAEKTLSMIFRKEKGREGHAPRQVFEDATENDESMRGMYDFDWYPLDGDPSWQDPLRRIVAEESVLHLDDLMIRRTSLGDNPARAMKISREICGFFRWDEDRCRLEIERLRKRFRSPALDLAGTVS
jgi:glycerol-3-phosphate dehydrogenase